MINEMRLAFHTVSWGRRIENLELALDHIAACGYAGVEIAQHPSEMLISDPVTGNARPIRDIRELLLILRARDLELVGLVGGTIQDRIAFCGDFRPQYLYTDQWDDEIYAATTLPRPFTLAIHPHVFMPIHRLRHAEELLAKHPSRNVRLLPDTAHLTIVGDDPVKAVRIYADRLAAVHLKDWIPNFGRYSQRYAHGFVELGMGTVALDDVVAALRDLHYQGWIVAEQDSPTVNPIESAFLCAQWLSERQLMPAPRREALNLSIKHSVRSAHDTEGDTKQIESNFFHSIFGALGKGAHAFFQSAADAFLELGRCELVQIWSFSAADQRLQLLAAAGSIEHISRRTLDCRNSLTGKVTFNPFVSCFDLSQNPSAFADQQLLSKFPKSFMVSVPIFNTCCSHHLRFVVNLFSREPDVERPDRLLLRLGEFVSRAADTLLDELCSAAAASTSYVCGSSRSKPEFLERLLGLVKRTLDCEAVAVFLVNQTCDKLQLAASTGTVWNVPKDQQHYAVGQGLTGKAWEIREVLMSVDPGADSRSCMASRETTLTLDRYECLVAPLLKSKGHVLGVIRCVNKRERPECATSTMFTDDDAAILDTVIQAAVPHLEVLLEQERQLNALTRMTHEFQVPMVAIRAAVDLMQHTLKERKETAKDLFGEDYLDDVLNWCGIMGRLASNAEVFATTPGSLTLRPSRTLLKSEVVVPAAHQVRSLLYERGFDTNCIQFGDFVDVPPLWIDRHQFQQVVFNLLSNSIKYAERGKLRVRINAGQSGNAFVIWFEDWGLGIEHGLEDLIFEPGYRSSQAMRRDASGQGIGLSVVRTIVEAHGGQVRLKSLKLPTAFEISLPGSLRIKPFDPSKSEPTE